MYIVIGLFCVFVFLAGAIVLDDLSQLIYIVASLGPIYIGLKMRKSNYALVSKKHIQVFGLFGQLKKDYKLGKNEYFIAIDNRIYLRRNKIRIKVKMNNWFVNQYDWERAIALFDSDQNNKITKHLIDD